MQATKLGTGASGTSRSAGRWVIVQLVGANRGKPGEMPVDIAKGEAAHGEALEVVAYGHIVAHADTAVQLDALLADESPEPPNLDFCRRYRKPAFRDIDTIARCNRVQTETAFR